MSKNISLILLAFGLTTLGIILTQNEDSLMGQEETIKSNAPLLPAQANGTLNNPAPLLDTNKITNQVHAALEQTTQQNNAQQIQALVKRLRETTNEDEQKKIRTTMRNVLTGIFNIDLETRRRVVGNLEQRVQKLKQQIAKRENAKSDIVELQLQVLVNEAQGLGLFSPPLSSNNTEGNIGLPGPPHLPVQPNPDGILEPSIVPDHPVLPRRGLRGRKRSKPDVSSERNFPNLKDETYANPPKPSAPTKPKQPVPEATPLTNPSLKPDQSSNPGTSSKSTEFSVEDLAKIKTLTDILQSYADEEGITLPGKASISEIVRQIYSPKLTLSDVEFLKLLFRVGHQAHVEHKPSVVFYHSETSKESKRFLKETIQTPQVALLLKRCVYLQVDADKHGHLIQSLRIEKTPCVRIGSPGGGKIIRD